MTEVREVTGGLSMYTKGAPLVPKRDSVKLTHRKVSKAFRELGDQALNAADFERTMHLPVGRGRLACDPDTGEFDGDAIRLPHNDSVQPLYPRYVHSTITEGESWLVSSKDEHQLMLATKKWADKPMERKKRFVLTEQDQMQNFQGQLLAERARNNQLEHKVEELLGIGGTPDTKEVTTIIESQMIKQSEEIELLRAENQVMKDRFEALMSKLEAGSTPTVTEHEDSKRKGK